MQNDNFMKTPIYEKLFSSVMEVHAYWNVFRDLFDARDNCAVLNRAGNFAAAVMQASIIDSMILQICVLAEDAGKGADGLPHKKWALSGVS